MHVRGMEEEVDMDTAGGGDVVQRGACLMPAEVKWGALEGKAKLIAAIVGAQAQIKPVPKDKVNDFAKYRYAPAEDIMEEARAALVANGLCLLVRELQSVLCELPYPDGKRPGSVVTLYFILAHVSGETLDITMRVPAPVEKGRPSDKAEAAAQTFGLGYTLRNLLLIPRSTESERSHQVDARAEGGGRAQQANAAYQPAATSGASDVEVNLALSSVNAARGDMVRLAKLAGELPVAVLTQLPDQPATELWLARIANAPDMSAVVRYGNSLKGYSQTVRDNVRPAFEKRMSELGGQAKGG